MLRAALFDMDGVLLDSERFKIKAWIETVQQLSGKALEPSFFAGLTGRSSQEYLDTINATYQLKLTEQEVRPVRRSLYESWFQNGQIPFFEDGVRALQRAGSCYAVALASSDCGKTLEAVAERLHLPEETVLVSGREFGSRTKPFPDVYLAAAQRLTCSPDECLVVEDSAAGVKAATSAGMYVIARPTAETRKQDFSPASRVVTSLDEIVFPLVFTEQRVA